MLKEDISEEEEREQRDEIEGDEHVRFMGGESKEGEGVPGEA